MTEYIQQIVPNAVIINENINIESNVDKITHLIKAKFETEFDTDYLKNFYKTFIENNCNEFTFELFIECIKNDAVDENFIMEIKNKKNNLSELQKFLNKKITNIKIKNSIKEIEKCIKKLTDIEITNYTDETIYNFISTLIENFNLGSELNENEDSIDYLLRVYKIYHKKSELNKNKLIKFLKNKYLSKYFSNVLCIHSLYKLNLLDLDKNEIEEFFKFMDMLYFDRDDGYCRDDKFESFDMNNCSKTSNIDLYHYFQNTEKQVNLISFIEEQNTPNPKLRTNYDLIKKLFKYGKLFDLLSYNVVVMCSEFIIENKLGYWKNIPINIKNITDFDELTINYPVNCINIYLDVDFHCFI